MPWICGLKLMLWPSLVELLLWVNGLSMESRRLQWCCDWWLYEFRAWLDGGFTDEASEIQGNDSNNGVRERYTLASFVQTVVIEFGGVVLILVMKEALANGIEMVLLIFASVRCAFDCGDNESHWQFECNKGLEYAMLVSEDELRKPNNEYREVVL